MLLEKTGEPLLAVWFGNFYRPTYDDFSYIDTTMALIKRLGFNCVELDAKAWEDFRARFAGGEASQYIKSQEYMIESAQKMGLAHLFLALYLNGDNLYPNIRFSPPIYGESVTNPDGSDGKWYRYWSDLAQQSMVEHVNGLLTLYRDNLATLSVKGQSKVALCSMWDPIVAPSFDDEGVERYLLWLKAQYGGDIARLNAAYGTEFVSFSGLSPSDYWFCLKYPDRPIYTPKEQADSAPPLVIWCDNMKWRRAEQLDYFAHMRRRLDALGTALYLTPNLAQWSYFLNVDGGKLSGVGFADLWDTAMRGIDPYQLSHTVDNCHWLTVPVTPEGDPDAYVVSVQHSMMRTINGERGFLGGIFWGRFLYNDLYSTLTPTEIIGSIVASGAGGMLSYGIGGLDDGGLLDRMSTGFLESLSVGNAWAKTVIPKIKGMPKTRVAILFPNAMATFEPLTLNNGYEHRLDLLGWYKAITDGGYSCDVLGIEQVAEGLLEQYKVLVIPQNSCYHIETNPTAEGALQNWVAGGGVLLHGPEDRLVEAALDIRGTDHLADCIQIGNEQALTGGSRFQSFFGDEVLASYLSDDLGCIVRRGNVFSFGFSYGYAYTSKRLPHVPLSQKNNALYPVPLLKQNPVAEILSRYLPTLAPLVGKGIECTVFKNGALVVNHTAYPVSVAAVPGSRLFQQMVDEDTLLPRCAVWIEG